MLIQRGIDNGRSEFGVRTLRLGATNFFARYKLPTLPRIDYETDSGLMTLIHQWWTATYSIPPLIGEEDDLYSIKEVDFSEGIGSH